MNEEEVFLLHPQDLYQNSRASLKIVIFAPQVWSKKSKQGKLSNTIGDKNIHIKKVRMQAERNFWKAYIFYNKLNTVTILFHIHIPIVIIEFCEILNLHILKTSFPG